MLRRAIIGVGAGGVVGVMSLGAAAWACTTQPVMTLQPAVPAAAAASESAPGAFTAVPSDSQLTVKMTGGSWAPTQAVQIHWNGLAGPLLATAQGGNFATSVQVPQVAAGVYYLTATDEAGATRVSQALEVTGPAGTTPTPLAAPAALTASHGSSHLKLGAEVLGGGLIALFSGAALTTLGRRRSSASRSG